VAHDEVAIREYWRFFELRGAAITSAAARAEAARPEWRSVVDALILARLDELESGDRAQQRDAIRGGRWEPYVASLRELGGLYARAGVAFGTWFARTTAFRDAFVTQLDELIDHDATPEVLRFAALARRGLCCVHDLIVTTVGAAYAAGRETVGLGAEECYHAMFENSPLPMWTFVRRAQKMEALGQLAGGVARDFNNVLTVVQSYACILEDSLGTGDPRHEDAAEIRRAAERASAITRQLLAVSEHSIVAPRAVSLDEIVTQFAPMLRCLVGPQIAIVTQLGDIPPVIADPGQIEQILMNLAVNARDAMTEGGRITIETRALELDDEGASFRELPPGRYVSLAVSDTGRGMDRETQARVFEPFFTTKQDTTRQGGTGTGLGLSIVHGIVTQAGGSISAYSEPGRGTTFRVHLPVASDVVLAAPPVPSAAPRVLRPATVLLVDGQNDVRTVAARVLRDAGCRVLEAASADAARRACVSHEGAIDVAVVDVVLPDGRGDALVHQLSDLRPSLGVLMMSGYPAGASSALVARPTDILAKPFTPGELRTAVARALGPVVASAAPASARTERGDRRDRVLLVDDDWQLRTVIARTLRKAEFEVVDVDNEARAIAELESRSFDVILSDVYMPDGTGLDLLRAVRRVDLDIPVVLMSGTPDVDSATAAVEYGAFRYLTKPLDRDVAGKVLRHAARTHALARLRRETLAVTGTHAGAVDRAGLEVRFAQAIEHVWMAFQPIVDAKTGALFGVEALLRSAEPSMPGPQQVLDAATQLGLLARVGRRVRSLSGAALASRTDGMNLFVNLHPEDLADIDLVAEEAPLTRIAPRVILEITERASLASSPELAARLARLRKLGFRIAIDDIGAGYSGLTSFTELMPEVVKIDMSLIRDVHTSVLKQRTISALCNLCHDVGCVVVGEGVETREECDSLIALGCDLLQGYLLGRPSRELPGIEPTR
jgi:signal transduction histidine kinase/EAL domain-containing protein (putative c-di-GMP-specific phosphodiesterase class I)/DNA-binding response OmpR family regulator